MNALERIRELLLKYNWSKYELAKRANVPQGTINQMFSRNYQPSISTLESICKGFGISMAEFFAEEETERHLTAEQVMLLNKWAELTDEQKEILLKFLSSL
ncbi:MAG: helix-turn-helix domain-containing protein [Oscillospiraceae bacterium]|jgi:transcriptional regulator with XRE-family HTH domain